MAKDKLSIEIPGTLSMLDVNPNTAVDGVLKLATVGAMVYSTKMVLDLITEKDFTDTVKKLGEGYYKVLSFGAFGALMDLWPDIGAHLLQGKDITPESSRATRYFVTTSVDELVIAAVAQYQAQIDADTARITAINIELIKPMTDAYHTADLLAEKALLQVDVASLEAKKLDPAIRVEMQAKHDKAINTQKWEFAVIFGILFSATLIYAGDSIIDLVSSGLKGFGFVLPVG
jgi:hypothetical protein